jgi:hypothetical protein
VSSMAEHGFVDAGACSYQHTVNQRSSGCNSVFSSLDPVSGALSDSVSACSSSLGAGISSTGGSGGCARTPWFITNNSGKFMAGRHRNGIHGHQEGQATLQMWAK